MDSPTYAELKERHAQILKEMALLKGRGPEEGTLNRSRVLLEEKLTIETQLRQHDAGR